VRTNRRDALPIPNALAFYAKILRCAAGASVGCMVQVVVRGLGQRIQISSTVCVVKPCAMCGIRSACWRMKRGNLLLAKASQALFYMGVSKIKSWVPVIGKHQTVYT
jgi:hypothetical protein